MHSQTRKIAVAAALIAVAPWIIASADQDTNDSNSTTVTIVGKGDAPQQTQILTMTAGVTTFAVDPAEAWKENASAVEHLRSELSRQGIDKRDVRTTSLDLSPGSEYDDENNRSIKGFQVRHNLTVVFRDIAKTGAILDALIDAGGNQVSGPRFSWEATEPALALARAAAIRDANNRANFFAKSLGLKVKRVVKMHESGEYASGQPSVRMANAAVPTVVSPGQDIVRVSVSGEYELAR